MPKKNMPFLPTYTAWNTASQTPETDDAANHTILIRTDGTSGFAWSGTPTDIGNGNYEILLTEAQANGDFITVHGVSSTPDVVIIPTRIATSDVANETWDELLTGATHNITTTAGRRLRALASVVIRDETAQGAGVNGNQIILDAGASSIDGTYDPAIVDIVGGTGTGQSRRILQYGGAERLATVNRTWKVNPDATSEFNIIADPGGLHVNEGLVTAATLTTITLNSDASFDDNQYIGQSVFITSGLGEDQIRPILSYDGATQTATIVAWDTIPAPSASETPAYIMVPITVTSKTGFSLSATGVAAIDDLLSGVHGAGAWTSVNEPGTGDVAITHDYGSADAYRIIDDSGNGVDGATVKAYLASDYAAGNLAVSFIKGETYTGTVSGSAGRWLAPLYLDAGVYTLVAEKPGVIRASTKTLTVTT